MIVPRDASHHPHYSAVSVISAIIIIMVEPRVVTEFYLPKLAALLSIMGSGLIMSEVGQDVRQQQGGRNKGPMPPQILPKYEAG